MKAKLFILNIIFIVSCSSNEYIDNKKSIELIGALEVSDTIMEVETDSVGNILDTILIEHLKYDDKKRKRYKKSIYFHEGFSTSRVDYFTPEEDLFRSEIFDKDEKPNSIFETFISKKGTIKAATLIVKEGASYDTLLMNHFHEFYPNGKIKKLEIKAFHNKTPNNVTKIEYNRYEKPLSEITMVEGDTLRYKTWEYADSTLQKIVYINYQADTSKSIYYFNNNKLAKENLFEYKNNVSTKSKQVDYFYNDSGEMSNSIEKNFNTKKIKYIKFIKQ
jgi:hypothetical protein